MASSIVQRAVADAYLTSQGGAKYTKENGYIPGTTHKTPKELGRLWQEKDIGGAEWRQMTTALTNIYKQLPEEFRTSLEEGGTAAAADLMRWNMNERKTNPSGTGPLDPIIALGWGLNKVSQGLSYVTGIHQGWTNVGVDLAFDAATAGIGSKTVKAAKGVTIGATTAVKEGTEAVLSASASQLKQRTPLGALAEIASGHGPAIDAGTGLHKAGKLKPEMANLDKTIRGSLETGFTKGQQVKAPVYTPQGSIIQEITEGSVKTTRDAYGYALGSSGTTYKPPWQYTIKGTLEAPRGGQATVFHHLDELSRSGRPILMHRSSMGTQIGDNTPLAKYLRNKHNLDIGHDEFNITHILDWQPKKQRNATVRAIQNQLGGAENIHFSTINDLEGQTALKSVDITEAGEVVPGTRGKVVSEGKSEVLPTSKDYPKVKVRHPETGEVLETLTFSNPVEYENRYKTVLTKYRELGFNVPETLNRKTIKTSPNLAMRGTDHVVTHRILDNLTEIPGNPLYEVNKHIKNNTINSLSVEKLGDLLAAQNRLEHQVAAHVLKNRYKLIVEYHDQVVYPSGQRTLAGRSRWKDLDVDARRRFFLEHVDHLAVRGGVYNNQKFMQNATAALKPIKQWDEGITQLFNIKKPRVLEGMPFRNKAETAQYWASQLK